MMHIAALDLRQGIAGEQSPSWFRTAWDNRESYFGEV
jgi:hypothetical protein